MLENIVIVVVGQPSCNRRTLTMPVATKLDLQYLRRTNPKKLDFLPAKDLQDFLQPAVGPIFSKL